MNSKILSFPLFHATSDFFLDSIKKDGLGGRNIITELNVLNFLSKLENFADKKLSEIDNWTYGLKYPISLITKQTVTAGGNFQHGPTFLTPALSTAVRYSRNKFGSELLSEAFKILELLSEKNIELDTNIAVEFNSIIDLAKSEFRPIILKINNLPYSYIDSNEKGNSKQLYDEITEIENYIREYGNKHEIYTQQKNFRAIKPIPFEYIEIIRPK